MIARSTNGSPVNRGRLKSELLRNVTGAWVALHGLPHGMNVKWIPRTNLTKFLPQS